MNLINVFDTIICKGCGHELHVTHEWLLDLSGKMIRRGLWHCLRHQIDDDTFKKLKCSQCGGKDFNVSEAPLYVPAHTPPQKLNNPFCGQCGGDGGARLTCPSCGGSGLRPTP